MSMQYKVPQNIDLEDKIVGPFTMKQFVYLLVGGGLIYGIYQAYTPYEDGILYTVLWAIPISFLTLALTFIKVNDRPFEYFLGNLFKFLTSPRRRLWQQGYKAPKVVISAPKEEVVRATSTAARRATLEEIAERLDTAQRSTAFTPQASSTTKTAAPSSAQPPAPGTTQGGPVDGIAAAPPGQSQK